MVRPAVVCCLLLVTFSIPEVKTKQHHGHCPVAKPSPGGNCGQHCQSNRSCAPGHKCCPSPKPCGNTCVKSIRTKPVFPDCSISKKGCSRVKATPDTSGNALLGSEVALIKLLLKQIRKNRESGKKDVASGLGKGLTKSSLKMILKQIGKDRASKGNIPGTCNGKSGSICNVEKTSPETKLSSGTGSKSGKNAVATGGGNGSNKSSLKSSSTTGISGGCKGNPRYCNKRRTRADRRKGKHIRQSTSGGQGGQIKSGHAATISGKKVSSTRRKRTRTSSIGSTKGRNNKSQSQHLVKNRSRKSLTSRRRSTKSLQATKNAGFRKTTHRRKTCKGRNCKKGKRSKARKTCKGGKRCK